MKSTSFFDLIDRIKRNQPAPENEDWKEYQPFLVARFLSMNIVNLPGAAFLNKYTFLPWTKEQHYELMRCLPWDSSFAKYIKGEKDNDDNLKEAVKLVQKAWKDNAVKQQEIVQVLKRRILSLNEFEKILVQLGVETRKRNKLMKWYKEKS